MPPGFELTFYSGVYGTCIGAMTQFGHDAKSLIGLSGICIGVGEILGESGVKRWRARIERRNVPASSEERDPEGCRGFVSSGFRLSAQEEACLGC